MSEPSKRQLAPRGLSLVLELGAGTARTAESCCSVSQHGDEGVHVGTWADY